MTTATTSTEINWLEAGRIARERGCSISQVLHEESIKQHAAEREIYQARLARRSAERRLKQEQREQYQLGLQALVTPEKVKPFALRIRDLFDSDPTAKEEILRVAIEAEAAIFPHSHDSSLESLETHSVLNAAIHSAAGLHQQETGLEIFLEDVMECATSYSDLYQLRYGTTD